MQASATWERARILRQVAEAQHVEAAVDPDEHTAAVRKQQGDLAAREAEIVESEARRYEAEAARAESEARTTET